MRVYAVLHRVLAFTQAAGSGAEILVHRPIAVIVKTVTCLRLSPSEEWIAHLDDTLVAVVDCVQALAQTAGGGSQLLVDRVVAVIVHAVANLRLESIKGVANLSLTVETVEHRVVAKAETTRRSPQTLVNQAVAIVVLAIALLLARTGKGVAQHGLSSKTVHNRVHAVSHAACRGAQILVNIIIAVIVNAIA